MTQHRMDVGAKRIRRARAATWTTECAAADRYLETVGVSLPFVRDDLIQAAAARLAEDDRSDSPRIREVRILACVERVLCERLGAKPGSDTTDPDTAARRLLFSIHPTIPAQLALLRTPDARGGADAVPEGHAASTRIPTVREHKPMPRQAIDFRRPSLRRLVAWVPRPRPRSRPRTAPAA